MDDPAHRPPATRFNRADWKLVLRRLGTELATDRVSLVAAGCAFYATLALFPAISMVIALYGLLFDPQTVVPHLALLKSLLPAGAFDLIAQRVHALVSQPPATLSFSLALGFAITLFSAGAGTRSIVGALNLAYETSSAAALPARPGCHHGAHPGRHGGGRAVHRAAGLAACLAVHSWHRPCVTGAGTPSEPVAAAGVRHGVGDAVVSGRPQPAAAMAVRHAGGRAGDTALAGGFGAVFVVCRQPGEV